LKNNKLRNSVITVLKTVCKLLRRTTLVDQNFIER